MIGFAGLSHLGIVSSIAAAARGATVIGYDSDSSLCGEIGRGKLPVFEPGLEELLEGSRSRIRFTSSPGELSACELIFFSVDVRTDEDNRSDVSTLVELIREVGANVHTDCVLVILSQVPPGFTREIAASLRGSEAGVDREVYCQVETLIFGRAVERALNPERLIVGCEDPEAALPPPYEKYLAAFGCPALRMCYESAELAKISINMCLVASIGVANTMAELCEVVGADWSEIVPALRLDRRIGQYAYLEPGLGIAGGNLERDLVTVKRLAGEAGTDAGIIDAWFVNSRHRRDWALRTIHAEVISRTAEPVVAVWGLSYKAGTASTKNSPALALIEALRPFPVRGYDPKAELERKGWSHFVRVASALEACQGADVLAIMAPWPEFSAVGLEQVTGMMTGRVVVDPYGVLEARQCAGLGIRYFRLGLSN